MPEVTGLTTKLQNLQNLESAGQGCLAIVHTSLQQSPQNVQQTLWSLNSGNFQDAGPNDSA